MFSISIGASSASSAGKNAPWSSRRLSTHSTRFCASQNSSLIPVAAHGYLRGKALAERSAKLLNLVRLDPDRVWKAYPHELSGGMRQRVLIALSLLLEPQLIIMDEPTTALDILTQRNIMDVLNALRKQLDFSLIFISHDLSLAAELADRVATMYAGIIVELSSVQTIFKDPYHPYTIGLINAVPTLEGTKDDLVSIPGQPPDLIDLPTGCKFHPRCPLVEDARCRREEPKPLERKPPNHSLWPAGAGKQPQDRSLSALKGAIRDAPSMKPIIELQHLSRSFEIKRNSFKAVDDVNLTLNEGEVVCLVGESGCGKTTTGKMIANLLEPTGGRILFRGKDINQMNDADRRKHRMSVQMVHQDPYASLNPAHTIYDIISAPLQRHQ